MISHLGLRHSFHEGNLVHLNASFLLISLYAAQRLPLALLPLFWARNWRFLRSRKNIRFNSDKYLYEDSKGASRDSIGRMDFIVKLAKLERERDRERGREKSTARLRRIVSRRLRCRFTYRQLCTFRVGWDASRRIPTHRVTCIFGNARPRLDMAGYVWTCPSSPLTQEFPRDSWCCLTMWFFFFFPLEIDTAGVRLIGNG